VQEGRIGRNWRKVRVRALNARLQPDQEQPLQKPRRVFETAVAAAVNGRFTDVRELA